MTFVYLLMGSIIGVSTFLLLVICFSPDGGGGDAEQKNAEVQSVKKRQLVVSFTFPAWVFATLVLAIMSGHYFSGVTNLLLLEQRAAHDAEFMKKVEDIRKENRVLRQKVGLQ